MHATKSGPPLFCSKIPVLVLAPSTGKPPPPSRKASIVLRARGHTRSPSANPDRGIYSDLFRVRPVIDCRLRLRFYAQGTAISDESRLEQLTHRQPETSYGMSRNMKDISRRDERDEGRRKKREKHGGKNRLCRENSANPYSGCI